MNGGFNLKKKTWERKECEGCKHHNQECRQGACSLNPYIKCYVSNIFSPSDVTPDTS